RRRSGSSALRGEAQLRLQRRDGVGSRKGSTQPTQTGYFPGSRPAIPTRGELMQDTTARASDGLRAGINDDIGEEKRPALYRLQVEIRESEQRAFDLFLQNLVKGTSHLSLGQEAVAAGFAAAMQPGDLSFCTYRGHAHTLARGVPIEQVLG